MIIEKLNSDLNIISALSDRPINENFSAEELKRSFDAAGNIIKEYINALTEEISEALTGSVVFSPVKPQNDAVKCNGEALSKEEYQKLYLKIGGAFGETEESFNLPNIAEIQSGVFAWILTGVLQNG